MPEAALPPAYALVLLLDRLRLTAEQVAEAHALASREDLDWGRFLDAAARHKLLPLIGRHVHRYRLDRRDESTEGFAYPWLFAAVYTANRQRNDALADEFARLFDDLAASGVRYAVRKGFALAELVYHDPAARRINDLDLLIERADAPAVHEVLARHGYQQGQLAVDGDRIEPFQDTTRLYWRMKLNNQLPYRKPGFRFDVPDFNVDLCHGLFQRGSGVEAPVADLLGRARQVTLCGAASWVLDPEDCLLDLCAHLYKEATSTTFIRAGMDLQLSKFLDIAALAETLPEHSWPTFVTRVEGYGAAAVVYYALHHANLLHPGSLPAAVLDRLRPADTGYLDAYGELEGTDGAWSQSFLTRLFDLGRRAAAEAAPPARTEAVLSARYHA